MGITKHTTTIKNITININTCTKELDTAKQTIITINNTIKINIIKIDTCIKDLEVCHKGNKKVCDDNNIAKYSSLFIKYTSLTLVYETTKGLYSKCQIDYNKLVIEIGELKRRKCETCEGSLKTCEQNITTITNNYNTKIDIKNKYDICEFDLKNEINLRITYFKESANWHKEFKNCSKQAICKEDEINMFKRVSEKCEESKITITKHLDSLKEKFGKLHKDKTSFFSESSNLLTNLSKKCSIDTTTLTKFMSTFDISVTELNNFREGIIAD